ncbi:Protein CBG25317 [Caenorhabditis briggsae]|uniref:Protein CBG25317 n=1 Tax=Caenorhabditis briggsae TaxID=6238 RepID=B6IH15_CAEBR|nr:Protein CBG25317 [Caenorhabditis briggsae]CAR99195.1 Protein CBG25317 [Caenorhabditis briggsae]
MNFTQIYSNLSRI